MNRYVCAVVHVLTFHVDTCVHKAKHIDRGTDAGCKSRGSFGEIHRA